MATPGSIDRNIERNRMALGPVQFVAYGFDRIDRFRGQILDELDRLEANGSIRVLDLLLIAKDDDGEFVVLEVDDEATGDEATGDDDTGQVVEVGELLALLLGFRGGGQQRWRRGITGTRCHRRIVARRDHDARRRARPGNRRRNPLGRTPVGCRISGCGRCSRWRATHAGFSVARCAGPHRCRDDGGSECPRIDGDGRRCRG